MLPVWPIYQPPRFRARLGALVHPNCGLSFLLAQRGEASWPHPADLMPIRRIAASASQPSCYFQCLRDGWVPPLSPGCCFLPPWNYAAPFRSIIGPVRCILTFVVTASAAGLREHTTSRTRLSTNKEA